MEDVVNLVASPGQSRGRPAKRPRLQASPADVLYLDLTNDDAQCGERRGGPAGRREECLGARPSLPRLSRPLATLVMQARCLRSAKEGGTSWQAAAGLARRRQPQLAPP